MKNCLLNALVVFVLLANGHAAELPTPVKTPAGWKVTLFAAPPNVGYPTALSTSPEGDLYVAIDENGSIDAKPGRGRVVRCRDTNHDGVADEFVTFAKMDSPRGIWFDHNVLYVQHPPFVSAFFDDNGDGVADRGEVLVKGLGFDLKFRGADHTINGMRMGIDGFLYIACGDYGGTNVVAKDGTTLQLHGGGVVRVRPDGTGLEIVSRGQRNIYDVAVSPELDLFTRDNTNDGDGWDVRLSHVVMLGQYGYPNLYKNFSNETIAPLADYGGGSPCGALFMDEPGFPDGFGRGLYTVEWGRGGIMRHPLTPSGSTYKAQQEKFIELSRPTDFDVDGSGRLYISSWHGATFTYNGPNAGFIVQVTPPNWTYKPAARPERSSDEELLKQLSGPSAFVRLYAQREILRRGAKPHFAPALEKIATTDSNSGVRVAAIFTLKQLLGEKANDTIVRLAKQDNIREFALRALADDRKLASTIPVKPFVDALSDKNPRVRLQAATAIGRLGSLSSKAGETAFGFAGAPNATPNPGGEKFRATASSVLPLVADADATVSHVAINALASMRASEVCLAVFDSPGSAALQPGAARVLQQLHEPVVVEGLIAKLGKLSDTNSKRIILGALARLYNREADWEGRWWGTRPDSTGPYFKPVTWSESEKIANVFKPLIANANGEMIRWLVVTLQKNRVDLPELTAAALKLADTDAQFRPIAVELFSGRSAMPREAVPLFAAVAQSESTPAALRLKAIRALTRSTNDGSFEAALNAIVAITEKKASSGDLNIAFEEFSRDTRNARRVGEFEKLATTGTPAQRTVAYAALTSLATGKLSNRDAKAAATRAVEQGWNKPETAVPLLHAVARMRNDAYALQVRSLLNDSRADVAAAAKQAAGPLRINAKRDGANAPTIDSLKFEQVVADAQKEKGDARSGRELFTKAGCIACHTTGSDEQPKGPFLGDIATRYSRAELCESILKPNAKIAQGFETQWFRTKDDLEYEGFVTREGGDDLDLRNVAGITTTLAKKDIAERGKREKSIMPENLMDKMTTSELASLLAFLETLKTK